MAELLPALSSLDSGERQGPKFLGHRPDTRRPRMQPVRAEWAGKRPFRLPTMVLRVYDKPRQTDTLSATPKQTPALQLTLVNAKRALSRLHKALSSLRLNLETISALFATMEVRIAPCADLCPGTVDVISTGVAPKPIKAEKRLEALAQAEGLFPTKVVKASEFIDMVIAGLQVIPGEHKCAINLDLSKHPFRRGRDPVVDLSAYKGMYQAVAASGRRHINYPLLQEVPVRVRVSEGVLIGFLKEPGAPTLDVATQGEIQTFIAHRFECITQVVDCVSHQLYVTSRFAGVETKNPMSKFPVIDELLDAWLCPRAASQACLKLLRVLINHNDSAGTAVLVKKIESRARDPESQVAEAEWTAATYLAKLALPTTALDELIAEIELELISAAVHKNEAKHRAILRCLSEACRRNGDLIKAVRHYRNIPKYVVLNEVDRESIRGLLKELQKSMDATSWRLFLMNEIRLGKHAAVPSVAAECLREWVLEMHGAVDARLKETPRERKIRLLGKEIEGNMKLRGRVLAWDRVRAVQIGHKGDTRKYLGVIFKDNSSKSFWASEDFELDRVRELLGNFNRLN